LPIGENTSQFAHRKLYSLTRDWQLSLLITKVSNKNNESPFNEPLLSVKYIDKGFISIISFDSCNILVIKIINFILQKRGLRYKEFKIFDQTLGIKASTQACPS
jgi:hypothetical protein